MNEDAESSGRKQSVQADDLEAEAARLKRFRSGLQHRRQSSKNGASHGHAQHKPHTPKGGRRQSSDGDVNDLSRKHSIGVFFAPEEPRWDLSGAFFMLSPEMYTKILDALFLIDCFYKAFFVCFFAAGANSMPFWERMMVSMFASDSNELLFFSCAEQISLAVPTQQAKVLLFLPSITTTVVVNPLIMRNFFMFKVRGIETCSVSDVQPFTIAMIQVRWEIEICLVGTQFNPYVVATWDAFVFLHSHDW